ncbi:hypothetical protein LMH87_002427 [Akanthomyces muscarius]|uniref:Uncharacterized protein n=1 Tax=Akanthomyces muscarius TaxID=2231603 RepID=A0A9W8Q8H4_AKAMU|nr:hypothetical protein LMH87_002427 [Akanthomyces muscarius]KAJ4147933.1 hypothetical protein LMH87_002427 [Akanthomyces muscarius]
MKFNTLALPAVAVLFWGVASEEVNKAADGNWCPACSGVKYTDPKTNCVGCCPVGYYFQGCAKGPAPITDPKCPADDNKVYTAPNGRKFTILCDRANNGAAGTGPDLPTYPGTPKTCAETCAAAAACDKVAVGYGYCYPYSAASTVSLNHPRGPGIVSFIPFVEGKAATVDIPATDDKPATGGIPML